MIRAMFSTLTTQLTEQQRAVINARLHSWRVFNKRLGRALVRVVGHRDDLVWLRNQLTAANLDPITIGAWRMDNGKRLNGVPINRVEWLKVAPDIMTPAPNPEDPPILSRPTDWAPIEEIYGVDREVDVEED